MGRRRRRKETTVRPAGPLRSPDRIKAGPTAPWLLTAAAILVAATFFLLGKYLELGSPDPFDSAAYVYSAAHLLDGAQLGVDEKSSARPATLLVNTVGVALFGFSETGPKLIQGLFQAAALVMMFLAMRRLWGRAAAGVSIVVAAYYLSAPLIAKFGNTKEQYLIALAVIGASSMILYERTGRWGWAVLTGAVSLDAYYFKETGIAIVVALAVYLVVGRLFGWFDKPRFRRTALLLLAGALAGLMPLAVFYAWQGQSADFWQTLPAALVQTAWLVVAVVWGLPWLFGPGGWVRRGLAHVRRPFWIGGLIAVLGMLIVCCVLVAYCTWRFDGEPTHIGSEVRSYLTRHLPGSGVAMRQIYRLRAALRRVEWILSSPDHYVHRSRAAMGLARQAPVVFRYYAALAVPMLLGLAATVAGIVAAIQRRSRRVAAEPADRFVVLLAAWWVLDVLLVWVSPRSYEQYYLPLTASGAMVGGYAVWWYRRRLGAATTKGPWLLGGAAALVLGVVLAWPIFFGFRTSRFSGQRYEDGPRHGYVQRLEEVRMRARGLLPWEAVGDYIRQRTGPEDTIYVWGWYPGIYVRAQRFSCAPQAFYSDMHVLPPERLASYVRWQVIEPMERKGLPAYIVDSRKQHFPWDRPPLELWPHSSRGPIGVGELGQYERIYRRMLAERVNEEEAARFDAMGLIRRFVMEHYQVVRGSFGDHVVLARRATPPALPREERP
ncbi:MAG TPA: hypothetical protein ENN87_17620 [Phycisphaerales bacterium]|nr:hypothetical protein [Phycisphaerales bacterium]